MSLTNENRSGGQVKKYVTKKGWSIGQPLIIIYLGI